MGKIHLNEAARKYGIAVTTAARWAKEAPPELVERIANLVLVDEDYIVERCIQLKRQFLAQAAAIKVELPEEEPNTNTIAKAA